MNKTYTPKPPELAEARKWYIIDATGLTLGRLATEVAAILRGKNKPIFSPHVDAGDYVIIINAGNIVATGKKMTDKFYVHHTMHPGGFRQISLQDQLKKHPTRPVYDAVQGMLPHTRLGRAMIGKLKVYAGAEHPHAAQQPEQLNLVYHKAES